MRIVLVCPAMTPDLARTLTVSYTVKLEVLPKKKSSTTVSLPSLTVCVTVQMNSNVSCGPRRFCMLNDLKFELRTQVRF